MTTTNNNSQNANAQALLDRIQNMALTAAQVPGVSMTISEEMAVELPTVEEVPQKGEEVSVKVNGSMYSVPFQEGMTVGDVVSALLEVNQVDTNGYSYVTDDGTELNMSTPV